MAELLPDLDCDPVIDLNACHEFEEGMTFNESGTYERELDKIVNEPFLTGGSLVWPAWHATAPQRCEAFIRTVCPEKWEEDR